MPPPDTWIGLVDAGLREDLGSGDATSELLVPSGRHGEARLEARAPLVVAGLGVVQEVFGRLGVAFEPHCSDGDARDAGELLARVTGPARGILAAERTALNFLQHLSGIATQTRRFCDAVAAHPVEIVDTRKTLPGFRSLAKFAVRCGGGANHRMGLYDGILIKDNHIAAVGSLARAVEQARAGNRSRRPVQVEVESLEQAREAVAAGAQALLIDNQPAAEIARIVAAIRVERPDVLLEASGSITLENVASIVETGVDRISVGALTHSAAAADIALEWNDPSSS
ncbi:MAG: carboxylating nicotinate-nucleotide diphosphorylase [Myxococcota bacterium]